MCLLVSQLSPQDLSGAKTGWSWGQKRLFAPGAGNRTLLCTFQHLHLAFSTPATEKISQNLHFLLGKAALPTGSWTANEGVHGFCGHVFTNRAGAGLNPRLGNELQLQEEKSNYIKSVPLDEPPGRRSSSGTHLHPSIIASNLQQRIYPSERGVEGDESCHRESASRGSAGAGRHLQSA